MKSKWTLLIWGHGTMATDDDTGCLDVNDLPYIAYMPVNEIENISSIRYYIGVGIDGKPLWSSSESEAIPLFSDNQCMRGISVAWNPFLRKWLMLYKLADPRGVHFRVADYPWGSWSETSAETSVIFEPWNDNGFCYFMRVPFESWCEEWCTDCNNPYDGPRSDKWGGEYRPYIINSFTTGVGDEQTTLYYNLSTWNPYQVVLMKSTLEVVNTTVISPNGGEIWGMSEWHTIQ